MAKSQAEYVVEVMAGPDGAAMTEVKCGFRASEDAEPCGCPILVHLASNVHWSQLADIKKSASAITLLDIQEAGGFLCDEHRQLLKEAGVVPQLALTTRQIQDLASRRRNEALRDDNRAATEEARRWAEDEYLAKLEAARAFAAANFDPRQKVAKFHGRNGQSTKAAATT